MTLAEMGISEIRFIHVKNSESEGLHAFASLRFFGFLVVRDFKIAVTEEGTTVVMFPSRPIVTQCNACRSRNKIRSTYCHHCGVLLPIRQTPSAKQRDFEDMVFVVHPASAEDLKRTILDAYRFEMEMRRRPSGPASPLRKARSSCLSVSRGVGDGVTIGETEVVFLGRLPGPTVAAEFRCSRQGESIEVTISWAEMIELAPGVRIGYTPRGNHRARIHIDAPKSVQVSRPNTVAMPIAG